MAQSGVVSYSKTAATNSTADNAQNWAEGQAPSSVNDSARGGMASVAKWRDDLNGTVVTDGTTTAYTVSSNQSFEALTAGYEIAFQVNASNTGTCTLAVDGLAAKPLRPASGVEFPVGGMAVGAVYRASYFVSNAGEWIVQGQAGAFGAKTFAAITATDITASGIIASTSTSHIAIAKGTTAQRPGSPSSSQMRFNTDTSSPEVYDGTSWNSLAPTLPAPQGYLTLLSVSSSPTSPVPSSDQSAKTTVYYRPHQGDLVPIPNGTLFNVREFTEMSLSLVSSHSAGGIFDVFLFDNAGAITIGTGPVWSTLTAGSGDRGSGTGTTELDLLKGLLVNKIAMTARNGSTTYSVAAKCGIYVGSILIDASAGQVTCHVSYGQSRKWGVWNAYNRKTITLKAGDGTSSWSYLGAGTPRAANNNAANSLTIFSGLSEEPYDLSRESYCDGVAPPASRFRPSVGIGFNSTSVTTGLVGRLEYINQTAGVNTSSGGNVRASLKAAPSLGIQVVTALEGSTTGGQTTPTWYGGEENFLLSAEWRG